MKRNTFSSIKGTVSLILFAALIAIGFASCSKVSADAIVPDNKPIYHDSDLTGSVWTVGTLGFTAVNSQTAQTINVDQNQNHLNPLVLNFIINTKAQFTVDQHGLHALNLTNYQYGWNLSNDVSNILTLTDGNNPQIHITVKSVTQNTLVLYVAFITAITVNDVNGASTSVDSMTITCSR